MKNSKNTDTKRDKPDILEAIAFDIKESFDDLIHQIKLLRQEVEELKRPK